MSTQVREPSSQRFPNYFQGIGVILLAWPTALILSMACLGLYIYMGAVTISLIMMALAVAGGIISGFSYLFRIADFVRRNDWKKPECLATICGATVGLGISVASNALGAPHGDFSNLGTVGMNATSYMVNIGAWSSIFNRAGGERPKYEKWIIRGTIGAGLLAGCTLVASHYDIHQFLGVEGLGISAQALGFLPPEVFFITGLTIVSTSCVDYCYRGLVYLFKIDGPNWISVNPTVRQDYRDAATGVFCFALPTTVILICLSAFTPLLPILPAAGIAISFIGMSSAGGGIFSRTGRAYRALKDLISAHADDPLSTPLLDPVAEPQSPLSHSSINSTPDPSMQQRGKTPEPHNSADELHKQKDEIVMQNGNDSPEPSKPIVTSSLYGSQILANTIATAEEPDSPESNPPPKRRPRFNLPPIEPITKSSSTLSDDNSGQSTPSPSLTLSSVTES